MVIRGWAVDNASVRLARPVSIPASPNGYQPGNPATRNPANPGPPWIALDWNHCVV